MYLCLQMAYTLIIILSKILTMYCTILTQRFLPSILLEKILVVISDVTFSIRPLYTSCIILDDLSNRLPFCPACLVNCKMFARNEQHGINSTV